MGMKRAFANPFVRYAQHLQTPCGKGKAIPVND